MRVKHEATHMVLVGIAPFHFLLRTIDIFKILFVCGYFEVPLGISSFGLCYPAHTIDPTCDYQPKNWLYWCDLSFLT